jgi:hypothetical protein
MSECDKYEVYTLKIDSNFAPANNSFIGYINTPLRNVVKAELLSASISANAVTSNVIYVYAMELDSKFNDRMDVQTAITSFQSATFTSNVTSPTSNVNYIPPVASSNIGPNLTGTFSNMNQMRTSLACIPADQTLLRTVFTINGYWDAVTEYIEPIRQIQQLTISLYGENGTLLTVGGPTFLNLRLTCAKPNRCLY